MLPPCSSNDSTLKAPLNAKVLKQQNIQIGKKIKLLSSKKKEQNEKNIWSTPGKYYYQSLF